MHYHATPRALSARRPPCAACSSPAAVLHAPGTMQQAVSAHAAGFSRQRGAQQAAGRCQWQPVQVCRDTAPLRAIIATGYPLHHMFATAAHTTPPDGGDSHTLCQHCVVLIVEAVCCRGETSTYVMTLIPLALPAAKAWSYQSVVSNSACKPAFGKTLRQIPTLLMFSLCQQAQ